MVRFYLWGPAMPEPVTFGRRSAAPAAQVQRPPAADPMVLSPQAEAFTAQISADVDRSDPAFGGWLRKQQAGRMLAWAITLALLSPGILCFALNAPTSVSVGVELVGMVANFWLRRKRRRHLNQIASWEA
jgi:hypothetical protein